MPKIELTDCFAFVFSGILMGLGLYHLISASQDAPLWQSYLQIGAGSGLSSLAIIVFYNTVSRIRKSHHATAPASSCEVRPTPTETVAYLEDIYAKFKDLEHLLNTGIFVTYEIDIRTGELSELIGKRLNELNKRRPLRIERRSTFD